MVLKLYAHPLSPYAQNVLLALVETKTPYELVVVDVMTGAGKTPEYLAKNPFATIPCIVSASCSLINWLTSDRYAAQDDDGFILFESAAIGRYIAAKAGSPLLPTGDLQKLAQFDQALSLQSTHFETAIQPLVKERISKPMTTGVPPDEALVATLAQKFEVKLAAYDKLLAKHLYLAGDAPTLADLFHLPFGTYAAPQGLTWFQDAVTYPNVARCVGCDNQLPGTCADSAQVVGGHQLSSHVDGGAASRA
jgi:glutathione S-transferase